MRNEIIKIKNFADILVNGTSRTEINFSPRSLRNFISNDSSKNFLQSIIIKRKPLQCITYRFGTYTIDVSHSSGKLKQRNVIFPVRPVSFFLLSARLLIIVGVLANYVLIPRNERSIHRYRLHAKYIQTRKKKEKKKKNATCPRTSLHSSALDANFITAHALIFYV